MTMKNAADPTTQIAACRDAFPGTQGQIFFNSSAHALMPAAARNAVVSYLDDCIREGGAHATMRETLERVRTKFAAMLNAEPDEIAIVKNVSEGINAIVTSIAWQPGDNALVCTELEHPNGIYALYNMRDRYGIEVRSIAQTADHAISAEATEQAIDDNTRLVIASSVTYTTGMRTDLDALAKVCQERDVLLLVDGAQSIGALNLDVQATPIDAMTVGASKYLCGPTGFGFLYVRRARAETMQPGNLARFGIDLGDAAHEGDKGGPDYKLMPAARRFELGSFNYAGANAVDLSLDLLGAVTLPVIERHVLELARRFTDGLTDLGLPLISGATADRFSHVVVIGRPEPDAATQTQLQDIHDHLQSNNVRLAMRQGRLRFSFHVYNTMDEVEAVLSMIASRPAAFAA